MPRDEIEGRKKRAGGDWTGPDGKAMTQERARDGESADGRAGGTGRRVSPEEEQVPRKTPGTDRDKKARDAGTR